MAPAPILPVTKVGPGDKQRAYVVRQNVCLKMMLAVLILVGMLSTGLLLSTYEIHLQRRHSLAGARTHREEEHASHMRVMRLSMLLQQHLEDDVHDVGVITTYRAWLMRAVGDYQSEVINKASEFHCADGMKEALKSEGMKFDEDIDKLLKRVVDDVLSEGKAAQKQLHNITRAIVSELRQDASEQGAYERVMEEAGEDTGHLGYHNHEVERLDGAQAWEDERDYRDEGEHEHHHYHDDDNEYRDDDDEEHLAGALEALLRHLEDDDSVLHVDNATLEAWTTLHDTAMNSLNDQEQEVDMDRVNRRIATALQNTTNVTAYNETEHGSEIDYLTLMLHKARLEPYREELRELLNAWQRGEERISVPIKRVEELIDDGVLEPDVLVVNGDYEHYHYNDE
mmetsp:Transcript_26621/g.53485  ORF Transcript_26621/g.53485 Transcript_26621/m.53485 type:complete len:397 (-) Transcript_26621:425-1615(-)